MPDVDELVKKEQGTPAKGDEEPRKRSRIAWLMGWVGVPLLVIGLIFGAGMLVGAHLHESWFTRLVVWFVGLF
jgi:hypothetical protein